MLRVVQGAVIVVVRVSVSMVSRAKYGSLAVSRRNGLMLKSISCRLVLRTGGDDAVGLPPVDVLVSSNIPSHNSSSSWEDRVNGDFGVAVGAGVAW